MLIWKIRYSVLNPNGGTDEKVSIFSSKENADKAKEKYTGLGYKILKTEKLYPVCSWERNQHKLYNAHDRAMVAVCEGTGTWEEVQRVDDAIEAFESCVHDGLVYATYERSKLIKDFIYGYDARH